jgi:hypothetical protein
MVRSGMRGWVLIFVLSGCTRVDLDLMGRSCENRQCAAGYYCDVTSNRCVAKSQVTCGPETTDEVCNGADDDCDGDVDEVGAAGCADVYRDRDGDGYGDTGSARCVCDAVNPPDGYVVVAGDCDDDPTLCGEDCNPNQFEICDGFDNDCDVATTEIGAAGCVPHYADEDLDGHGAGTPVCLCAPTSSYPVTTNDDCDDDPSACGADCHPGATEVCDGYDNNCAGGTDPENSSGCTVYYNDVDRDGYGRNQQRCLCAASGQYDALVAGDCDDVPSPTGCGNACSPADTETCDRYDNDCNGTINDSASCTLPLRVLNASNGLVSNSVSALAVNPSNGALWVATSQAGGASYLPSGGTTFSTVTGLKSVALRATAVDGNGGAWFAYQDDGCDTVTFNSGCDCGPTRTTFSGSFSTSSFCTDAMDTSANGVMSLAADGTTVFIGTQDDFCISKAGAAVPNSCDVESYGHDLAAMLVDPTVNNFVWIAMTEGYVGCSASVADPVCGNWDCLDSGGSPNGVDLYSGADNLSSLAFISGGDADPNNDLLYVGSNTNGLARTTFNNTSPIFFDTSNKLPSDDVRALAAEEGRDLVWVGTSAGLVRLAAHTSGGVYVSATVTTSQGLPSNDIRALAIDEARKILWIGTAAGVVRGTLP